MDAISCTAARANLAMIMDRVTDKHEAVIITRQTGQSVVMMSLEDIRLAGDDLPDAQPGQYRPRYHY